jgi:hypothetical protein
MIFRLACLFVIVSQLVLLTLYLRPTGGSAILFTFIGNPLLVAGVLLAIVWVLAVYRRIRSAKVDRGDRDRAALGGGA